MVSSWRLRGTPASVTPPVSRAHNRPPLAPVNGRSLVPLRCLILRGHAARRAAIAQLGRAHVCTPVTNAHLVCRLLLEKKKKQPNINRTTTSPHKHTRTLIIP